MMGFFDYFQVVSVAIPLLILVGKAAYLRLSKNINPVAIGGGKRGLPLAVELIAFAGLSVWVLEVLLSAFHSVFRLFPSPLRSQLIDSLPARSIGVVLVTL